MTQEPPDPIQRFGELRRELEARWPETRISPTLSRIRTLTQYLGDPQRAFPVIHVTGTNGKTTTARMIEVLLREFGLHTGLVTSPHLSDLRERIRLDGEPISIEHFLRIHDEIAHVLALADETSVAADGPPLSFFEVMTAMAFAAFADAPVDVAVVEVGMGGAWDATNIADGQVAVFTPIGLDHMQYLGDTIRDIASEKVGIIKPTSTVITAAQEPEAAEVLFATAAQLEAPVALEGRDFGVVQRLVAVGGQQVTLQGLGGEYREIYLPLFGEHQARNAATALAAVEAFFGVGAPGQPDRAHRQLEAGAIRSGFASVTSPGRLEVVRRSPTVVVDAAHNASGALALAEAIADSFSFSHMVAVVGVLVEKDAAGILEAIAPVVDEVVITQSTSPRAIPTQELAAVAVDVLGEDRVHQEARLDAAIERAVELSEIGAPAGVGGGVLITGSVTVAGEARMLLGAEMGEGAAKPDHAAPRRHAREE